MSKFDPDPVLSTACFFITAEAEPGVLPRIVELFAKRGLTPSHLRADWSGAAGDVLAIEVRMAGMDRELAAYIGRCLRGIATVREVRVSEQRHTSVA